LLLVAGCSSADDSSNPPDDDDSQLADTTSSSDELILDYTLYVEGGIQNSGIDASPVETTLALVTDFEKVLVYSLDQLAVVEEFGVQLGDTPRQGSTEAVAFTAPDELAVLYPDAALVRRYSLTGELVTETDLSGLGYELAGGMAVLEDGSLLLATSDSPATLLTVSADGQLRSSVELAVDGTIGEVSGLSVRDTSSVYVGTDEGAVFLVDVATGTAEALPAMPDVGEFSDLLYFVNPEDEAVIAVTDDADEYNDTEAPIRLYLLP
jgi:outer membrane protein assembly factor BamB